MLISVERTSLRLIAQSRGMVSGCHQRVGLGLGLVTEDLDQADPQWLALKGDRCPPCHRSQWPQACLMKIHRDVQLIPTDQKLYPSVNDQVRTVASGDRLRHAGRITDERPL